MVSLLAIGSLATPLRRCRKPRVGPAIPDRHHSHRTPALAGSGAFAAQAARHAAAALR